MKNLLAKNLSTKNLSLLLLALILASAALPSQAAIIRQEGQPTHYVMTLKKVELCASGSTIDSSGVAAPTCVNPYVIGSGTTSFDVASATAGAAVGSYANLNASTWPVGTTFTHIRATISRAKSITAAIAVAGGPGSGQCITGGVTGTHNTLATGADSAGAAASTTIYEQDAGSTFGGAQTDIYQNGQVHLDNETYTQLIPLTAPYTAVPTLPTIRVSFDMPTAVAAMYLTGQACDGSTIGGNSCCFDTGPLAAHIAFQ